MFRLLLLTLPAALTAPRLAVAQGAYPNRPVTILLSLAPGGSADPRRGSGGGAGYGPDLLDELTVRKSVHLEGLSAP